MSDLSTIDDLTILFDEFLHRIDGGEISAAFDDLPVRTPTLRLFEREGWVEIFRRQFAIIRYCNNYDDELIDATEGDAPMVEIVKNCLNAIKTCIGDNLTVFCNRRIAGIAHVMAHEWFSFLLEYIRESKTMLANDLAGRMGVVYD